jgi:6-phosphofructokinase
VSNNDSFTVISEKFFFESMRMIKKRIGILTGGGDVPPLNAVIASARIASERYSVELIGFIKGWLGVAENHYVDLSRIDINPLIGGTVLKSSRVKIVKIPDGIQQVRKNIERLNLDGLIVIGGEDTLSNSFELPDIPQVLISKTIDNDVGLVRSANKGSDSIEIINYFTLGFPTAARRMSSFVSLKEGLRTTAYSHERIIVVESMGMHAGWLALASSLGHPDFIVIPEFQLNYERLLKLIVERYEKEKNVIVVVAEGAKFDDGSHISADESEKDDFGHPKFKGSAETLSRKLKEDLHARNVNGVNPSYLYRSGAPVDLDLYWADKLGKEAVRLLFQGIETPFLLTIKKGTKGFSIVPYPLSNFKSIEGVHRFVDNRFFNPDAYAATDEGKKYLGEIAEEIPKESYGLA